MINQIRTITCSAVAIEPWHASSKTLFGSPNNGCAFSWSFKQLISSHPVMKTKTAPGRSLRHMWHRTASMRLNPMQSGFQFARESRVLEPYVSKLEFFRASCIVHYYYLNSVEQGHSWTSVLKKYLNKCSNLIFPFSRQQLSLSFPDFILAIIIKLIAWGQPVAWPLQYIFQKMCSHWMCESLN